MTQAGIIISVLKTRLMSREDLNGNQKHGYGIALQEIEESLQSEQGEGEESQLKPQEGEWISVKDKLPEIGNNNVTSKYVLCRGEEDMFVVTGYYSYSSKSWVLMNRSDWNITHWQSLLTPPKG